MRPKLLLLQSMCGSAASLVALTVLPACHTSDLKSGHASTTAAPTPISTTTAVAAPPTTRNPRSEKWIDLQVGDCLAELPSSDPSVVTVTVVDCGTAHAAEVYLRGPLAVNAAVADVANRECASGLRFRVSRIHRAIRRRQLIRGDLPHRLRSGSDIG
jgi:hypothetical protein